MGGPLVANGLWEQVDEDVVFAGHRPDTVSCPPDGAREEAGSYEVQTDLCNYLAATQPALVEVRAGDTLVIDWTHSDLVSLEPAQAHLGIAIGKDPVWETTIALQPPPASVLASAYRTEAMVSEDAPSGVPVYLHIHNHGANAWRVYGIEVVPGEP